MKTTDYVIQYLIEKGVTDLFGYPGGVICHFLDSAYKFRDQIRTHTHYHEQAAAFAACGYAQETGKAGVAFSTSGPWATNLVTGIANAYFDSIPTIFFTGQVDTYAAKGSLPVRQRGFQETDIVDIVHSITKYAIRVDDAQELPKILDKAYTLAVSGRPGPVLLDLPADVQRADLAVKCGETVQAPWEKEQLPPCDMNKTAEDIFTSLSNAMRPCLLLGNGVKQAGCKTLIRSFVNKLGIPVVSSMPAFDILPFESELNFGFIGANGHRYANIVLAKSDLIVSIGSRLDLKQVGNERQKFPAHAELVRIDVDTGELAYKVRENEKQILADLRELLPCLLQCAENHKLDRSKWLESCKQVKTRLMGFDDLPYTAFLRRFCREIPDDAIITADVGQNEVWLAQQLEVKEKQTVHLSAGHGTMGYSLPAAIGAYYGSQRPVYCFNGDGGIQMNIQEFQFVVREQLPIKIIVLNNHALGMIRGFQKENFDGVYTQTVRAGGYTVPDFSQIAQAYGIPYKRIRNKEDLDDMTLVPGMGLIEIEMPEETVLQPNFGKAGSTQMQRPEMESALFEEIMAL